MGLRKLCWRCSCSCFVAVLVAVVAILLNSIFFRRSWNCRMGTVLNPLRPAEDPKDRLRVIHLVYSSDFRGFAGVLASMVSVTRHLAEPEKAVIHFITDEDSFEQAEGMARCFEREFAEQPRPKVVVQKLLPLPFNYSVITWAHGKGPGAIPYGWIRLFLPDYLPDVPRAIWLDNDIIVKGDLAPLYRMSMNHTVAAVSDVPIVNDGFNSGLLLVDLERFKKEDRSKSLVEQFEKLRARTTDFADQDVLNAEFPKGHFHELDWRWNSMGWGAFLDNSTSDEFFVEVGKAAFKLQNRVIYNYCWEETKVLHFTMGSKWWFTPHDLPNCHLVSPYAVREACGAWSFHCSRKSRELK